MREQVTLEGQLVHFEVVRSIPDVVGMGRFPRNPQNNHLLSCCDTLDIP